MDINHKQHIHQPGSISDYKKLLGSWWGSCSVSSKISLTDGALTQQIFLNNQFAADISMISFKYNPFKDKRLGRSQWAPYSWRSLFSTVVYIIVIDATRAASHLCDACWVFECVRGHFKYRNTYLYDPLLNSFYYLSTEPLSLCLHLLIRPFKFVLCCSQTLFNDLF